MSENVVNTGVCNERHKSIDEKLSVHERRLNAHSERISTMEDAVLKLTLLVEQARKRDIYDKILTICIFIMCLVLLGIVLGPEIMGKIISNVR